MQIFSTILSPARVLEPFSKIECYLKLKESHWSIYRYLGNVNANYCRINHHYQITVIKKDKLVVITFGLEDLVNFYYFCSMCRFDICTMNNINTG